MLILVQIDLTEKGRENKAQVLENLDYRFTHPDIVCTEIVDVVTEE